MSEEIKPLKIIDVSKKQDGTFYLTKESTAIKIPKRIVRSINKINQDTLLVDSFITALHLRSFGDDDEAIKNWNEEEYPSTKYPVTTSNRRFSKYMQTLFLHHCFATILTQNELWELIYYFAKCPHGYSLPGNLIRCHHENRHLVL